MKLLRRWFEMLFVVVPAVHAGESYYGGSAKAVDSVESLRVSFDVPIDIHTQRRDESPYGDLEVTMDARKYLPADDIYVKSFTFKGVTVDSEWIPWHVDTYADEEESIFREDVTYTFHHSSVHSGHQEVTKDEEDVSFHQNGVIALGTRPHATAFGDYGMRLRPDTRVFVCMHGFNFGDETKTFVSRWEVEYYNVGEEVKVGTIREAETNPLVAETVIMRLPRDARVNDDYMIKASAEVHKSSKLVGLAIHKHPWNHLTEVYDQEGIRFWSHDENPGDDGEVTWLTKPLDFLIAPSNDSSFTVVTHGTAAVLGDLKVISAVTFVFELKDGSDRKESITELTTHTTDSTCINCYVTN